MRDYDDNQIDDYSDEAIDQVGDPFKKSLKGRIRSSFKKVGQGVRKAFSGLGKAFIKGSLVLVKALLPFILPIFFIFLLAMLTYFAVFEFVGTEKRYSDGRYTNEASINEDGIYITSDSEMSPENKQIIDFYKYMSGQSFHKILGRDGELKAPDEIPEVRDYHNREENYGLSPNLLFSLDKYVFRDEFKYPEQFIKPVNYNKETFTLEPLVDEKGMVKVKSKELEEKTGKETGRDIFSVRDFGLGSIFVYNEKEDYTRTLKIKGEYVAKDVWDSSIGGVRTVGIREEFELPIRDPEDIYIIDKIVLFVGEIEFEHNYELERLDYLRTGASSSEKEPVTEFIYDVHYEPNCWTESRVDPDTGESYSVRVCGEPTRYELKKYRSSESAIFEEIPQVIGTKTNEVEFNYLYSYLSNFEAYVPEDVIEGFDFTGRINYDSYIFDSEALLTDDFGFNLGSATDTDKFRYAYQFFNIIEYHAHHFDVDPYMILAMMTQESGGRNDGIFERDGPMQIVGGNRSVTARNRYGELQTIEILASEKSDRDKSIAWGTAYYKQLLDSFNDPYKALQAYNFGPGTLRRIERINENAWSSNFGWLIYREAARREQAPNTHSASYGCMAFPEGTTRGRYAFGDSCYIENVLRYYMGHDIESIEVGSDSIWSKLSGGISGFFSPFIREKTNEPIPSFEFKNYIKENIYTEILMTTKALDGQVLYSQTLDIYEDMDFWDKGFMESLGSLGINLTELINISPNKEGFYPPIIFETGMRITSTFGPRRPPVPGASSFHRGVDIGAPRGTPVYASAGGEVVDSAYHHLMGNYVKIDHKNGTETLYMHLHEPGIRKGSEVKAGDQIGIVGTTGASSGYHLHFELRVNNVAIDPIEIVRLGQL